MTGQSQVDILLYISRMLCMVWNFVAVVVNYGISNTTVLETPLFTTNTVNFCGCVSINFAHILHGYFPGAWVIL